MALKHVNAVVVGAGAGGGVVAKELAAAGFSVVCAGTRTMAFSAVDYFRCLRWSRTLGEHEMAYTGPRAECQ